MPKVKEEVKLPPVMFCFLLFASASPSSLPLLPTVTVTPSPKAKGYGVIAYGERGDRLPTPSGYAKATKGNLKAITPLPLAPVPLYPFAFGDAPQVHRGEITVGNPVT